MGRDAWIKRLESTRYWRDQWRAGIENMPTRSHTALAACLGLRIISPGHAIDQRLLNGRKPRDAAVRARLLKYAGPQGATLAIMRLTTLGLMHRYR